MSNQSEHALRVKVAQDILAGAKHQLELAIEMQTNVGEQLEEIEEKIEALQTQRRELLHKYDDLQRAVPEARGNVTSAERKLALARESKAGGRRSRRNRKHRKRTHRK
jgi:peptidoglycan hydrolase CwlO-like protein